MNVAIVTATEARKMGEDRWLAYRPEITECLQQIGFTEDGQNAMLLLMNVLYAEAHLAGFEDACAFSMTLAQDEAEGAK